jgi:6-phosphogluconolactonase
VSDQRFIAPEAAAAAEAAAHHIAGVIDQARASRGFATLAISGGTTPKLLFARLTQLQIAWDAVHLFWADERCVPPTDPASNYRLANESLIGPAGIPQRNIHRVQAELPPEAAATRYVDEILDFFDGAPHFDLVHLGMGPDAHTASLFPGDPLINDRERVAAATFAEKFQQWRVTLLPAALLAAEHTVFLVSGADKDKKDALRAVFEGEYNPLEHPAQLVARNGRNVTWFLSS